MSAEKNVCVRLCVSSERSERVAKFLIRLRCAPAMRFPQAEIHGK
jgi:hypothetical protein